MPPPKLPNWVKHTSCKNPTISRVENAIFVPSHDILQTHFVSRLQSENSKGNFMEFATDIIFSTFVSLRKTRFEQSNFARIFDLIAFLRRSKIISSGCLPRNCRMTANSSLQMAKTRKNHRFAAKPPKLPEACRRSHLRGERFRTTFSTPQMPKKTKNYFLRWKSAETALCAPQGEIFEESASHPLIFCGW